MIQLECMPQYLFYPACYPLDLFIIKPVYVLALWCISCLDKANDRIRCMDKTNERISCMNNTINDIISCMITLMTESVVRTKQMIDSVR